MTATPNDTPAKRTSGFTRGAALVLLFTLIIVSIFVIRSCMSKDSEFSDDLANQIEQELADNQILISKENGRRSIAEFKEPIILTHGKESRLIVYTAHLSETLSIANEGMGGWKWTSAYKEIVYEGDAQYTVDLSKLSEKDFVVNNELKTLTVRIPYAVLSPINIPADQIKFGDVQRGWAAPKDIKMTAEENTQLMVQVHDKMKAKLIDENIIALANKEAKIVVADLLSATVHSIDPEYSVIVVQ